MAMNEIGKGFKIRGKTNGFKTRREKQRRNKSLIFEQTEDGS